MRPRNRVCVRRKAPETREVKDFRCLRWIQNEITVGDKEAKKVVKTLGFEREVQRDGVVKKTNNLEEKPKKTRFSCPICYNEFSEIDGSEPVVLSKLVIPRLGNCHANIAACGHSICSKCLIGIVEVATRRSDILCPLDRVTVTGGFLPFNLDVIAYNAR